MDKSSEFLCPMHALRKGLKRMDEEVHGHSGSVGEKLHFLARL